MQKEVIVVGGGLAGLSATLKLAELGCHVKLVSVTKVKRSHSVCAQGGINAAMNTKGEGDSPNLHAYETVKGGDFLADQPAVLEMCLAAPHIVNMMDRFGCPFNRNPEGHLDFRGFGGTLFHRTAFCGGSTGQQLLYTLDEQVRRWEVKGQVEKYEFQEFMRLVLDKEGRARGIVMMDLFNLKVDILRGDAVVVASGGPGLIFKPSTNSTFCTGAANGRLMMQGMQYANAEFIQIHPTTIPGEDKARLISEGSRGEGGRFWVPGDAAKTITGPNGDQVTCGKTGEPWYFMEELYPAYGNVVPRDIAARVLMQICEIGLGIEGKNQVYLDVSHLPPASIHKLKSILDIYRKFSGEDPAKVPMRVFPGVHYSMGGAWIDYPAADAPDRLERFRHMTNIQGLFNAGESDFAYHGANRLGANSLMSCIFSGLVTGVEVNRYVKSLEQSYKEQPEAIYDRQLNAENTFKDDLMGREGEFNIYGLHDELSELMVRYCTVWRHNDELKKAINGIKEIREKYKQISLDDRSRFANQSYIFANQFQAMIELSLAIAKGALLRDESRGSHYKAEFPERDDENWLKISIATWNPDEPEFTFKRPEMPHWEPALRDYTKQKLHVPEPKNVPENIALPL
jgi:succinate dehydrogenase / fumarate reductase flavoprotein subunit